MLHTNASNSSAKPFSVLNQTEAKAFGPSLLPTHPRVARSTAPSHRLLELATIASRRCSSFFAEAAVLVLVFGVLDFFMLKGRIELTWIVGSLAISVGLLLASIATDYSAQRWIKAHP